MDQATIRHRLHALRERRGMTQTDLSSALGFNDRQTLSDIELGKRSVSPAELVKAAGLLGVDVGYFTDPLELAGEARFSWRQSADSADCLEAFEATAGRWIATYRHLGRMRGTPVNSSLTRVGLTIKSSFEDAGAEGDAIARALGLGDVPALTLASVLEEKHDTLVLFADTVAGVSGAACQFGPLNAIIINRGEAEGRRSFDMAHEVFHLATWHEMPPRHIEGDTRVSGNYRRVEQLADNFASGLLMPRQAVLDWIAGHPVPNDEAELPVWIKHAASHFHVSGQAFKWRLVGLGVLGKAAAGRVDDGLIRMECGNAPLPPLFSRRFMETLGWGIQEGQLSVRRAAEVVGTTLDELADIFAAHGLKTPFDL